MDDRKPDSVTQRFRATQQSFLSPACAGRRPPQPKPKRAVRLLPGERFAEAKPARRQLPCFVLHRGRFIVPRLLLARAVGSYPAFSPLPDLRPAVCFLRHCLSSFAFAKKLPQVLCGPLSGGVRTFLPQANCGRLPAVRRRCIAQSRRGKGITQRDARYAMRDTRHAESKNTYSHAGSLHVPARECVFNTQNVLHIPHPDSHQHLIILRQHDRPLCGERCND